MWNGPTLEAHWRRLAPAETATSAAYEAPCPRRLHTSAVVYARCVTPTPTASSQQDHDDLSCRIGGDHKLLVVFGGTTTAAEWHAHCHRSPKDAIAVGDAWPYLAAAEGGVVRERAVPRCSGASTNTGVDATAADQWCFLDGLHAFDLVDQAWLPVELARDDGNHQRPSPRAYHAAVAHDDRLIISGGKSAAAAPHSGIAPSADCVLEDVWQCSLQLFIDRSRTTELSLQRRRVVATWTLLSGAPIAPANNHNSNHLPTSTQRRGPSPDAASVGCVPQCYHAASIVFVPQWRHRPLVSRACTAPGHRRRPSRWPQEEGVVNEAQHDDAETSSDDAADGRRHHLGAANGAMLMVCSGGHNGHAWDDRLRVFDLRGGVWLPAVAPSPTTDNAATSLGCPTPLPSSPSAVEPTHHPCVASSAWGDAGCHLCPSIPPGFCVHQSHTVRPIFIRKLLASQQQHDGEGTGAAVAEDTRSNPRNSDRVGPSMPPRDGHSMVLLPPVHTEATGSMGISWAMDGLVFGGEVALTTFNTLLEMKLSVAGQAEASDAGTPPESMRLSVQWGVVSGGSEYHRRLKGSPPRLSRVLHHRHMALTTSSGENNPPQHVATRDHNDPTATTVVPPSATACGAEDSSVAECRTPRVLCISESPDRRGAPTRDGVEEHSAMGREGDGDPSTAAPEHRSFHIAWPCGVSGLLVFGGVSRGDRVLSSLYYFDRIAHAWVKTAQVSPEHPGPRASCSVASQPPPASPSHSSSAQERCLSCGAPSEACYLFGGETTAGRLVSDHSVWELTMHAAGCGGAACDAAIRHLSAAPLSLTPPPKRQSIPKRHDAGSSGVSPPPTSASITTTQEPTAGGSPPWKLTMSLLPLKVLLAHYMHRYMPDALAEQRGRLRRTIGRSTNTTAAVPPSLS